LWPAAKNDSHAFDDLNRRLDTCARQRGGLFAEQGFTSLRNLYELILVLRMGRRQNNAINIGISQRCRQIIAQRKVLRSTPRSGLCGGPRDGMGECHCLGNALNGLDKNTAPTPRSDNG